MSELNWKKIDEGVAAAREIEPPRRSAWLDDFCEGEDALKNEIESLLEFEIDADGFLEQAIAGHAAAMFGENHNSGRVFGNYEIEREIGHGGMGAVYLARRTDGEFDQQVALKVVRASVADSRMVERFRQERQILASLSHPNIAKLLDGGVSAVGEPFLAMEYIEGETITEYVERTNPSVDDILVLFMKVCSAVSYAHRNLVVHRDIKPGNILVTGDGEPRLLDFGLAKLAEDRLASGEDRTETMFRALTPAYASPEQFLGQPITTASDIYSLGVVLFELLTGERPFHFEKKPLDQIVATITSHSPPLPSSVRAAAAEVQHATGRTQERRPHLQRSLKGDLDTIILMSLRKSPERRYQSVESFADDIERYIKGLPVSARANTRKYRAVKFIKRHKFGVLAASLIFASLAGGITVSIWQTRQAGREKAKAEAVSSFMKTMLDASSPDSKLQSSARELTVKDVLNDASNRLASAELSGQPEVRAELQQIIGESYYSLGQYDLAEQNLLAALDFETTFYGADHIETLQTTLVLAGLWVSRGDNTKAVDFYRRSIPSLRLALNKGTIKPDYFLNSFCDFAIARRAQGDSKEAEVLLRESLILAGDSPLASHNIVINSRVVLGLTLSDQGRFDEAIDIVRSDAQSIGDNADSLPIERGVTLIFLGRFQMEQGDLVQAERNLREGEAIYRRIFSPTKLELGDVIRILAETLYLEKKYAEAEQKITETLKIYRESTSSQYVNYPTALRIQGMIYSRTGRIADAEKYLREAVALRVQNLPENHFARALDEGYLGEFLMEQQRFDEAELLLLKCLESLTVSQDPNSPRIRVAQQRLFELYSKSGKPTLAESFAN